MFTVLCTKIEGLDTYCFTAWKSCIQANSTVINLAEWSTGFFKLFFLSFLFPQHYFFFCCGVVALLASLKIRTLFVRPFVSLQPRTEAGKPWLLECGGKGTVVRYSFVRGKKIYLSFNIMYLYIGRSVEIKRRQEMKGLFPNRQQIIDM